MISFTLKDLATLGNYVLKGQDMTITEVSTDSRNTKDALFVALKGEHFDGHDFIEKALDGGACAVLSEKPLPQHIEARTSVIYTHSTLEAYGYCGLLVRRQCHAKIASLTGSCGKTTVKEFTHAILQKCGKSLCTEGNFNNDVGVPKTLLRLDDSYDYAVIEQGASHLFDIAHTCEFVRADTALINNVGEAHIEGFGSYDGVYKGKSEILESVLSRGGTAVVPYDSKYYARWESDYRSAFRMGKLFTFGTSENSLVRISDIDDRRDGVCCTLSIKGEQFPVKLQTVGVHNAFNAAAAAALAHISGAGTEAICEGLRGAGTLRGRLTIKEYQGFTVIDDAYNASFNAVIAAINTLKLYPGKRVMIFGDMGELGDAAVSLHRQVGECALENIDEILCVGPLTQYTCESAARIAKHFNDSQDLVQYTRDLIARNHEICFLIKGSHAMHMDKITEALCAIGENLKN
jgi:UDP-N-acetylmuramoyl-tripeptide--D-alanyl-D-alanine ligase